MENAETSNSTNNILNDNPNCIKEQDRLLPIANVGRIMKQILPPNAKISKEAKETMQECVSEFIAFVTSEASDKCRREKRKTVNGDDICWALGTLGFDDYGVSLKRYLLKYRDLEGDNIEKGGGFGGEERETERNNIVTTAIPSQAPPPSYGLHHGEAPSKWIN